MQLGSTLALSGNEFATALESSPGTIFAPGDLAIAKEVVTLEQPTELVHIDRIEGIGFSVGPTSTVTFRYIVRRVRDSVIVQRNDNKSYPVCRLCIFNAHGQTYITIQAVVNLRDQKDSIIPGDYIAFPPHFPTCLDV